jgi:asparagine synthase (glutamine-hydrolysing)
LPGDILAKADKMSMAFSLELRVPFLDREVFEVARKIPAKYRIEKQMTKRIFREALKDVVPENIVFRPKLGFPVPLRQWLRGKRGSECLEVIRSSGLNQHINMHYVEQLVRQHQDGKADHARKIWSLYILAQWHVIFLDNTSPAYSFANSPILEDINMEMV